VTLPLRHLRSPFFRPYLANELGTGERMIRRLAARALVAAALVLGPAQVAGAAPAARPTSAMSTTTPTTAAPAPGLGQSGPILESDDLFVPGGAPLGIKVLLNDRAGTNPIEPSTLAVVTPPGHGTVKIEADHTLTYVPAKGYVGADSFDYQVCDTTGACSTASVFVSRDTSQKYVTAGYLIVGAVIGGYAFRTLRRGRKLSPLVPAERRRWM
jgi:Bacterial Ig domain